MVAFDSITVDTVDGTKVQVKRQPAGDAIAVQIDGESLGTVVSGQITPPAMRLLLREKLGGKPVYLPAFRSVLEAIGRRRAGYPPGYPSTSVEGDAAEIQRILANELQDENDDIESAVRQFVRRDRVQTTASKTALCRTWFGEFVPVVRYPSLHDVAFELQTELEDAVVSLASTDRKTLASVFIQVLRAVTEGTPEGGARPAVTVSELLSQIQEKLGALEEVQADFPEIYSELAGLIRAQTTQATPQHDVVQRILSVYDNALQARLESQRSAFVRLETFQQSVNRFFSNKELVLNPQSGARHPKRRPAFIQLPGGRLRGFEILSSGERQVLSLLFAATHMTHTDGIVLIDEPELSLHIDWKRIILREMSKQAGDRQIIACTHAPEVAADHRDQLIELVPTPRRADQDRSQDLPPNCD